MSLIYSCNTLPATGAAAMYALRAHLITANWTCVTSGDGLAAYDPGGGTAITHAGAGANGMNNSTAWFRMRMDGTSRELLFQRGAAGSEYWKIRYTVASPFNGGAPAAAVAPTSTNSQKLLNDGSADQGNGVLMFPAGAPNRVSMWADNAAPYGFGIFGWTAAGVVYGGVAFEAMVANSFPTADADPYTWHWATNSTNEFGRWTIIGNNSTSYLGAYYKSGLAGEAWCAIGALCYYDGGSTQFAPAAAPVNPYTGYDDEVSLGWGRAASLTTQTGWKGIGTYLRAPLVSRAALSTLSVASAGAKDRLVLGTAHVSVPWDGSTPLL